MNLKEYLNNPTKNILWLLFGIITAIAIVYMIIDSILFFINNDIS